MMRNTVRKATARCPRRKLTVERLESKQLLAAAPLMASDASDRIITFEGFDQECWSRHIAAPNGFNVSHPCNEFTFLGESDAIELVQTPLAPSGQAALKISHRFDEERGQAVLPIEGTDYLRTEQLIYFSPEYDFGFGQKIHRIYSADEIENVNFEMVVMAWGRALPGYDDHDMSGINDTRFLSLSYNGSKNPDLAWGSAWSDDFRLQREVWHKLTTEVQLNDPGQQNGWVKLYVDDVLVAELSGLEIRDTHDHLFNRVLVGGWYSNGAAGLNPAVDPQGTTYKLIDSILISTTSAVAPDPDPDPDDPTQGEPLVDLELIATDINGNRITKTAPGERFFLDVYAGDLRDEPSGVFSAFFSIDFPSGLAEFSGPIFFGADYPNTQNGDFSQPGIFRNVGAVAADKQPIDTSGLLVRIPVTATNPGELTFSAGPPDAGEFFETTLVLRDEVVSIERVRFGTIALTVQAPTSSRHNQQHPADVDDNGRVTPLDALLIINFLNRHGIRQVDSLPASETPLFLDTNNDGLISPADALFVINALNRQARISLPAGESAAFESNSNDRRSAIVKLHEGIESGFPVQNLISNRFGEVDF